MHLWMRHFECNRPLNYFSNDKNSNSHFLPLLSSDWKIYFWLPNEPQRWQLGRNPPLERGNHDKMWLVNYCCGERHHVISCLEHKLIFSIYQTFVPKSNNCIGTEAPTSAKGWWFPCGSVSADGQSSALFFLDAACNDHHCSVVVLPWCPCVSWFWFCCLFLYQYFW